MLYPIELRAPRHARCSAATGAGQPRAAIRPAPLKALYTINEAAPIFGLTVSALSHRRTWKRFGGIKRGRNVKFPASALTAISNGQKP